MPQLLIDHNFDERVLRRLRPRISDIAILLARDVGLERTPDEQLLTEALLRDCIVLTHDASTVTPILREKMRIGDAVPRVIVVVTGADQSTAVNALEIVLRCSVESDWLNGPIWIPL